MSVKLGRESFVGVGIESSPDSAVAASKYLPFVTCTMRGVQEPLVDEAVKGIRDANWGAIVGQKHGEGDIETYVDVENAPYLIYSALGSCSTVTASEETAVWEHTFTRKASNPPKTLTIIYDDTQDVRKYTYAAINTLELNVSDGLATISANILSRFPSTGTGSESFETERILAFKDYSVKFGSGATGTAALTAAESADATKLSSFTLSINNNLEAQYLSNDNDIAQISMGEFAVTGEYVLFFDSTTDRDFYETMLDSTNTVRAMIATFTGDSIGVSGNEEIEIRIPNFHLSDRTTDTSGFITENPSFVAEYDPTETKTIQIKITNETSSY